MRFRPVLTTAACLLLWVGAAQAAVEVTFTGAEKYADGTFRDFRSEKERAETQAALRKVFTKLGDRYLAPGQTLTVNVTALDLAGRFEPWRPFMDDVRFMRAITWPQMEFTYSVEGGDVPAGTAKLADMNYLNRVNSYPGSDSLRYERQMLTDWFAHTFRTSTKAAAH